jgi:filamentous hemagglutinin family protein
MMRHLRSPILAGYLATLIGLSPMSALANPQGGQVAGGQATISGQGTAHVTVNQGSHRAIINWNTFNIGAGEKTQFVQPGADAIALNRVTGNQGPSTILGTIEANGRVFLVNRDGILFGSSAVINTSGFLATTHDIKDADFMAGRDNFTIPGNPSASIVNLGTITANNAGIAALVAPGVRNSGTITAELGKVALASNNGFTLDFYGDKLITMQVDGVVANQVKDVQTGQTLDALVKNEGPNAKLSANGGRVELTAAAARHVVDAVINNKGVIEANSVGTKNGKIVLGAATASTKGAVADVQKVKVSGTLSAAGKKSVNGIGERGGNINIIGEDIRVSGALVDVSGKGSGGSVQIGGEVAGFTSPNGGALSAPASTATAVNIDAATTIDVSGRGPSENDSYLHGGMGGRIGVWADQTTTVAGTLLATGSEGSGPFFGSAGGNIYVGAGVNLAFSGRADTHGYSAAPFTPGVNGWTYLASGRDLSIGGNATSYVTASALAYALARGNVQVMAGLPFTGFPKTGSLTVAESITWATNNALSLYADQNIAIAAGVTIANDYQGDYPSFNEGPIGAAGPQLSLRAGMAADGGGRVTFGDGAMIDFSQSNGKIDVWHNTASLYAETLAQSGYITFGDAPSSGRVTEYWWVNTLTDLQNIFMNLGANYALSRNLDASETASWSNGVGFVPIGQGEAFTGRFEGLGHTISNLTINSSSQYVGLFGYLGSAAVVRDLGLVNAKITSNYAGAGYAHLGTLAGINDGTITNVYATGIVTGNANGTGSNVGGLVGTNDSDGSIERSHANVVVSAGGTGYQPWVGGLVGQNSGTIFQSYAEGAVTGTSAMGVAGKMGGLVGYNSGGTVSQSYALGSVWGNAASDVGGLVGHNTGIISETYASGRVTGGASGRTGGLVGNNTEDGNVSRSFFDADTTLQSRGIGNNAEATGVARLSALGDDARQQSSYDGWNFGTNPQMMGNAVWFMIDGFTRPFLRSEWSAVITNAHQLQLMAMNGYANYTLANNINLGPILNNASNMWGANGFAPIGTGSLLPNTNAGLNLIAFNGVFDGQGHTIDGLRISSSTGLSDSFGLFGAIGPDGAVRNLNLTNADISADPTRSGAQYLGVLAGRNQGSISNVTVSGAVRGGNSDYVTAGGLVGENSYVEAVIGQPSSSRISSSSADVAVTAGGRWSTAGGLAGTNSGRIVSSSANGAVMGGINGRTGGLVGANYGALRDVFAVGPVGAGNGGVIGGLAGYSWGGAIENAWATGSVTGGNGGTVGGLIGHNGSMLANVWASGDIQGVGAIAGGLIGDNWGTINHAWASGDVNISAGASGSAGGLIGFNSGVLTDVYATGDVVAGAGAVAGGLVGANLSASITDAWASGNVTGGVDSFVGGLVGYNGGLVFGGVAYGDVTAGAGSYVGGLVGLNYSYGSLAVVKATGNVSSTGAGSKVGGLVGRNDGLISGAEYIAASGKGVYGTSDSAIGGLVGLNDGIITNFFVDPPVVGSGSGNSVGGAVGDNSGTLQDGTVVADVSGGSGSSVGLVTGVNSGSVSGVSSSGTVNGVDPNTTPNNPPANDPPPINPTNYTPPSDPNRNTFEFQTSDPTSSQGQSGSGGQGSGQGGGQGGQGGGNGAAGNNNPPPQNGPPPGPGIGRTVHEQRFSGVPPINETRFLPGEVVVQVANTVPAERIQEVARQLGITLIASQAIDGSGRVVYRFSTGNGKNIRDVIRALERQQIVASAQPNYVFGLAQNAASPVAPAPAAPAASSPAAGAGPAEVETGSLPPSPELSSDLQSDMASRTTGLPRGDAAQYIIDKLRLGVVHTRAVGRNIPVAVIDSEIDVQHPDLVGVVSETFDATGTASNPHAHGTGMAGAIASHRRLLGIAPGVKILAVKAFDETNTSAEATSFQILKGLDWALTKKPRIINMSFAGPRDLMLERALQKAYEQGIVLIAAAGNAGPKSPPLYPAADVNVIAVSASDHADKPFAMANRGKHIAVAAPGVDVLVPSPKGGYQLTTGTSVAAAHVSGVAALLLESRPTLTPKEVRAILTGSAKPVALKGGAEIFGAGLVDPFEALSRLGPRPVSAAPAASAVQ